MPVRPWLKSHNFQFSSIIFSCNLLVKYWTGLNFPARSVLMFGPARPVEIRVSARPGLLEARSVHSSNLQYLKCVICSRNRQPIKVKVNYVRGNFYVIIIELISDVQLLLGFSISCLILEIFEKIGELSPFWKSTRARTFYPIFWTNH